MSNDKSVDALTVVDLVELFKQAGSSVTVEDIEADVEDGAPTNPDGTLNVLEYGAWVAGTS